MDKMIRISEETANALEARRHPGQSYDGIIQELLEELDKYLKPVNP